MDLDTAARRLAELGNPTRLALFRTLVRAGPDGLAVGALQDALGLPASTLAFHLRGLVTAGLVTQERAGRSVLCRPAFDVLDGVLAFLKEECCRDAARPGCAPAAAGPDPSVRPARARSGGRG